MMTLTQLTEAAAARNAANDSKYFRTSGTRYAVGRNGSSYAGRSGDKLHLLVTYTTTDIQTGKSWTTTMSCQHRNDGRSRHAIVDGLDTDAITCTKCRAWADRGQRSK